ncbi:branched-chain amino acid ABC transporter permease [Comamonas endophytica]|uniref:Branched-chain amino acid ABC transporter permease n=1 Tax=Comamonas endophytica TaxID=2949090 RepID=A0ABY6GEK5_9BURK|nr:MULTISPECIES: branched-chain amino acid ABC transporter permease [unclassified Acidovorax]MCD2512519.1 branched-chain amino acid ABC transporter permease [Acidovorax sp. D4N7]UYG53115.1 branched-chain amino acid ABC transporter permease [Acidovorax sp. 5MLIR]
MTLRYLLLHRSDAFWTLLLVAAVLLGALVPSNDYYLNLMVLTLLYAGLASAWNIVGGMAGQFSLGHTAFVGIGAYTSTVLLNYAGISPWLGMLVGAAFSMLLAVVIAFPTFRMRGVFFAMATLAFSETVRILLIYSRKFVDLPYGLSIDFQPGLARMVFEDRASYVWLAGGYLALVLAAAFVLSRSFMGFYLRAIRDNEDAAEATGVPVRRYKLLALLLSAAFSSIGGTLMAQYVMYIEPGTVFTVALSVDLALMSILGGVGTLAGPVLGAAIALPFREFLVEAFGDAASGTHLVVYGLLLIVIVVLLPQGLLGGARSLRERIAARGRRSAGAQPKTGEQ